MRTITLAGFAALFAADAAGAQTASYPTVELRPFVGAFIPTGAHANDFKSVVSVGSQAGLEISNYVTLTGNFAYSPATSKIPTIESRVHAYTYDLGAEFRTRSPLLSDLDMVPFLGAGLGGRTYDYADSRLSTESFFLGYGSAGTEFQITIASGLASLSFSTCALTSLSPKLKVSSATNLVPADLKDS